MNQKGIDFTTAIRRAHIRRSPETGSKAEAQELHDKLEAESWRVQKLEEKPKYTWDDAGFQWLKETEHKRTHREDMKKLAWLQQFFRGKELTVITLENIMR